ncbi:MAG TPA: alpha-(1-_6)-mannopyranosyltransferase A [Candidatus Corynebacterium gallistercoris]|uniref:Alpha-(1->6)-mannopyranosyltransferase A n=1 Tax=Candidatus Corynebacterium gallistercoris TaxID=2838530 RepID=A0A9D1RYU3_9CORY|nr:alpha-(1->6)-mannopyranosyltransferase A [Candidatus Corynebacterium gallistercoris]
MIGAVGSIIIALTSHAVGAVRSRGGIMQELGLTSLTFGHSQGMLMVVLWLGIGALIISWIIVGGRILRVGERLTWAAALAWTAPLLFAGPLMSRDVYSYLMQGTLARDGFNPYHEGAAANPGPLLFEVSPDWRNTTTPYGPLHLGIAELVTRVTGDNITGGVVAFKLISFASVAVMAWALKELAQLCGVRADVAIWLGVLNPLSIIHLIGGMHNENMMMAVVLLALLLCLKFHPGWGIAGAALIGVGVALKATAFIALPFMVWVIVVRFGGRKWVTFLWSGFASVVAMIASLSALTALTGQTWGWVAEVTGNTKVINPLALPSFIASTLAPILSRFNDDITFNAILSVVRPWTAGAMVLAMVLVWWLYKKDVISALEGITIAYLVTCVLNSVVLPWYYTAPLALVALWARRYWVIYAAAVFSMWISLMFDGGGNNRLYDLWWVLSLMAVCAWLASVCLGYRPRMTPGEEPDWDLRRSPSPELGASLHEPGGREGRLLGGRAVSHPR